MKRFLLAACAVVSVPAFAQMPPPPPGPPPAPLPGVQVPAPGMQPPMGDRIGTRTEVIARIQQRFAMLDTNHDGALDQAEIGAAVPPRGEPAQPGGMRGGMGARMLAMADANHDGRVTLQEAVDAATRRFDMVDTNHDGQITPDERAAARARLQEMRGQR